MKSKLAGYLILLAVVAVVSGGVSYFAVRQSMAAKEPEPDVANARKWLHEAELSADQLEKLEPVESDLRRDLTSLQIVLAQERIALCTLIKDDKQTPEILQNHINRISQLEGAQQELVVKHLATLSGIMNSSQKEKFFDAMMSDICTGCRNGYCRPGTPCMCGHCNMSAPERS
jgi:hypothetical protein